jgi:hypothetical protein
MKQLGSDCGYASCASDSGNEQRDGGKTFRTHRFYLPPKTREKLVAKTERSMLPR